MGPIVLATVSVASVDIAAAYGDIAQEWVNTTGQAQYVATEQRISGLNTGGASSISLRARLVLSGTIVGIIAAPMPQAGTSGAVLGKEANGDSVSAMTTLPILVPNGYTLEFRYDSANASDTTATVAVTYFAMGTQCLHSGLLQSATGATMTIATTAPATADIFNNASAVVVAGAGVGQQFRVLDYTAGRVATLDRTPDVTLDNTSLVALLPAYIDPAIARTTTAGTTITVTNGGVVPTTIRGSA